MHNITGSPSLFDYPKALIHRNFYSTSGLRLLHFLIVVSMVASNLTVLTTQANATGTKETANPSLSSSMEPGQMHKRE